LRHWYEARAQLTSRFADPPNPFKPRKEMSMKTTPVLPERNSSPWQHNDIQFPRLLAEIMASGAIDENARIAICQSMDLLAEQLQELFDRAQTEWEQIKTSAVTVEFPVTPPAKLICPTCGYEGKEPTEHGEGFRYLANHTTWREIEGLKGAVLSINGFYQMYDEDEETNERLECRSCLTEFPIPSGVETDFQ
jgi:hypothetical protein